MKSQTMQSKQLSLKQKIGWVILLLMAVFPVLFSLGYLSMDPENFNFTEQKAVYTAHMTMLITHVSTAMLAILIGPFQFLPGLRKGRLLKIHRWLGRAYLLSVLFGGISGLYMAQFAYGGIITELGFATLACLWLYSGYRAYRDIRNKNIEGHREWMIRNYALTLAGLMLRVWVPLSIPTGIDFTTAYRFIGWLCWVPNLLVAEWIVRRTRRAQRRGTVITRRETPQTAQADV